MTKTINKNIHNGSARGIALFLVVILAGFFCLSAWAPGTDAEKGKGDNSTSITSTADGEDTPGVQEQEQETPPKIAQKHFPWLWVAAGVVVVGVVLYFTVFKKPEYKLTVSVGTGVSGTPASGTVTYKKGKKVSYAFNLKDGYKNLRVNLDNVPIAAAGEIEMNRDHNLVATATEELYYDLTVTLGSGVTGTPAAGSYSHKEGTSIAYSYAEAAGYANLKVQVDGVDAPAQGSLIMDRSHALSASAEKIIDVSGVWQLTFTMVKKGTVTTVATFFLTYHMHGPWREVQAVGGGFDFPKTQGLYLLSGRKIEFRFLLTDSYYHAYEFDGILYDDDNRMSGTCLLGAGDPFMISDTGTWSAQRL